MARKRILMVDDSNTMLMMNKLILAKEGYEILTAHDGREGVELARAERPDLILMDVVMPNLGGFDAVKELQESDSTRDIPVIMLTTRGEKENVTRGRDLGAAEYLTKPVNAVELLAKVKMHLGD
jgi:DNA-binding response OmpR family regulator